MVGSFEFVDGSIESESVAFDKKDNRKKAGKGDKSNPPIGGIIPRKILKKGYSPPEV